MQAFTDVFKSPLDAIGSGVTAVSDVVGDVASSAQSAFLPGGDHSTPTPPLGDKLTSMINLVKSQNEEIGRNRAALERRGLEIDLASIVVPDPPRPPEFPETHSVRLKKALASARFIKHRRTGKCLGAREDGKVPNHLRACNGDALWSVIGGSSTDTKLLKHALSAKCLTGTTKSVYLADCDPTNKWQQWKVLSNGASRSDRKWNLLQHDATKKCLGKKARHHAELEFGRCHIADTLQQFWLADK